MFTVTLNQLRASNAFGNNNTYSELRRLLGKIEGSRSLLNPFGKAYGLDTPIRIPQIANAYSVEVALMALRANGNWQPRQRDRITMRYVIKASSHVLNVFEELFPNDQRPRAAIDAAAECLEFYSLPDAWLAQHNWDDQYVIPYTAHAAQAALDSADGIVISDAKAEAAKYAAWAAGQTAVVAYDYAWPAYCEKRMQQGYSASELAEFLAWAYSAADLAAEYSHLAALMSEDSVYRACEWQRSRFLEILAAEDQDI